jgi:hypothetical protein
LTELTKLLLSIFSGIVILDNSMIPHPQRLNLAEQMERAAYLGLDEKWIVA